MGSQELFLVNYIITENNGTKLCLTLEGLMDFEYT